MDFADAITYTMLGIVVVLAFILLVVLVIYAPLVLAFTAAAVGAFYGVAGIIYWLGNR